MKLKVGDNIKVMSGKDRGKTGKIIQVFPDMNRVVVEGVQARKRHLRPQKAGEKGQIVEFFAPIAAANVSLLCVKCGKPTRIGVKTVTEPTGAVKKLRVCKKCQETIG